MNRRVLSFALAIIMLFCMISSTAIAADVHETGDNCLACQVAALINALPDADDITIDNAAQVIDQIHAIDRIKFDLTDEEYDVMLTLVDGEYAAGPARYNTAVAKLNDLVGGCQLAITKAFCADDEIVDVTDAQVQLRVTNLETFAATTLTMSTMPVGTNFYSDNANYDGWTFDYVLPAGTYRIEEISDTGAKVGGANFVTGSVSYNGEVSDDGIVVTLEAGEETHVSLMNSYAPSVFVMAVDADGSPLEGAHIQILYENGELVELAGESVEWDSTDVHKKVQFLTPDETYILHVTAAPDGYEIPADIFFSFDDTGKVTSSGAVTADGMLLVEFKKAAPEYIVYLSNVGMNVGDYLAVGANTVSATQPKGGYAHLYENADGELVLELVNFENDDLYAFEEGYYYVALYSTQELTVQLIGMNTLTAIEDSCGIGILVDGQVIIDGMGSLTIRADDEGIDTDSGNKDGDVEIEGGIITIYAESDGIDSGSDIFVRNNANVTVNAENEGFEADTDIEINDQASVMIRAGGDGFSAGTNDHVEITGGIVTIYAEEKGICAQKFMLSGGYLLIYASDDGIDLDDDEYEYISSVEITGGAGEIFSGEDSMAIRVWESDDFNFSIPVLGGYPIETFNVDAYEGYTYVRIGSMSDWPVEDAVYYGLTLNVGANGTAEMNNTSVTGGTKVTVTTDAADEYTAKVKVTVSSTGEAVEVTDEGNGVFSFRMPHGDAVVDVTFASACSLDAQFTDLDNAAWYHDGVHYAVENGLMVGLTDTTFGPNAATTRAQIVTVLWRLEGSPKVWQKSGFSDVPAGEYYTDAVAWAAAAGIVSGFEDGTFAPNANVTSEQLLSILMRYADYKGVDVSAAAAMIAPYEYAEWAETAVVWAHINGMLGEKDDLTGDATRAEIAMRLYKMAELLK